MAATIGRASVLATLLVGVLATACTVTSDHPQRSTARRPRSASVIAGPDGNDGRPPGSAGPVASGHGLRRLSHRPTTARSAVGGPPVPPPTRRRSCGPPHRASEVRSRGGRAAAVGSARPMATRGHGGVPDGERDGRRRALGGVRTGQRRRRTVSAAEQRSTRPFVPVPRVGHRRPIGPGRAGYRWAGARDRHAPPCRDRRGRLLRTGVGCVVGRMVFRERRNAPRAHAVCRGPSADVRRGQAHLVGRPMDTVRPAEAVGPAPRGSAPAGGRGPSQTSRTWVGSSAPGGWQAGRRTDRRCRYARGCWNAAIGTADRRF